MNTIRHIVGGLALSCLLICSMTLHVHAQEMPVPVDVQLSLYARILSFDRTFNTRTKREVVIGILYQREFRPSFNVKENILQTLGASADHRIHNKPVRVVEIDISESMDPLSAVTLQGIDILYVAPLRAVEISFIVNATRASRVRSFTGIPEYVNAGIAVGVGSRGDRPEIIINLTSAKLEGAEFSSQLLKLAKIVQ